MTSISYILTEQCCYGHLSFEMAMAVASFDCAATCCNH